MATKPKDYLLKAMFDALFGEPSIEEETKRHFPDLLSLAKSLRELADDIENSSVDESVFDETDADETDPELYYMDWSES